MKPNKWYIKASILCVFVVFIFRCNSKENTKLAVSTEYALPTKVIKVEAENFTNSNVEIKVFKESEHVSFVESNSQGWIALDVNIPIAGRYKSEIKLTQNSSGESVKVWIEDYYDNLNNRQYNITGDILVQNTNDEFVSVHRDGSPLNSGLHRIRIHFDKGVKIDWVRFTILSKHNPTPLTLMQKTSGKKWNIIWSDEFDGEELDQNKWTYDIGNWGWGNQESQYYTVNDKNNARLENGNLIIEARKNDSTHQWTSARITTRGKVSFLYGKIEFKAKVPHNKGNWAAGWLLGDAYVDELSWPYCGEIDILESLGYQMDDDSGKGVAHAAAHCIARYFRLGNQPKSEIEVSNMNTEFHVYSVEWLPNEIKIFVDNKHYFTYNDTSSKESWPFVNPHNIILNLTIGGGWGGSHGIDETINSQKMIVDYVRVYELN